MERSSARTVCNCTAKNRRLQLQLGGLGFPHHLPVRIDVSHAFACLHEGQTMIEIACREVDIRNLESACLVEKSIESVHLDAGAPVQECMRLVILAHGEREFPG